MKDGPDGRVPGRNRGPDSIWERYLTGKLSLEDKDTLLALIKKLHQEIAQHLGHKADAKATNDVAPLHVDLPTTLPPAPKAAAIVEINVNRTRMADRRRIDPRQN